MLAYDPQQRYSAHEVSSHPFLRGVIRIGRPSGNGTAAPEGVLGATSGGSSSSSHSNHSFQEPSGHKIIASSSSSQLFDGQGGGGGGGAAVMETVVGEGDSAAGGAIGDKRRSVASTGVSRQRCVHF